MLPDIVGTSEDTFYVKVTRASSPVPVNVQYIHSIYYETKVTTVEQTFGGLD
jgi:hypothetical protein